MKQLTILISKEYFLGFTVNGIFSKDALTNGQDEILFYSKIRLRFK